MIPERTEGGQETKIHFGEKPLFLQQFMYLFMLDINPTLLDTSKNITVRIPCEN
jgi:hypothetical protein